MNETGQPAGAAPPLLRARDISVAYKLVRAVESVDLDIFEGETLGLVGESGCGKTTLGRTISGLTVPARGRIDYRSDTYGTVDIAGARGRQRRGILTEVRVIFQDPFASLNPRMTIKRILGEPLRNLYGTSGRELEHEVSEILERVGLSPRHLNNYPHAFSGGERQRINIARALITRPRLVIADEPVSALDVSIRAQILNLLRDLQDELRLSYLFISHDMSVIENICDRVAVMYMGRIVEVAPTEDLFRTPSHPYTEALLNAVPIADPRMRAKKKRALLSDESMDTTISGGCAYQPRCRFAEARCGFVVPPLAYVSKAHRAACIRQPEVKLDGGY